MITIYSPGEYASRHTPEEYIKVPRARITAYNEDAGQNSMEIFRSEWYKGKVKIQAAGSARLSELSKGKNKIVVLASDHTRPVPSKVIMPMLLSEILTVKRDE